MMGFALSLGIPPLLSCCMQMVRLWGGDSSEAKGRGLPNGFVRPLCACREWVV